MCWHAHQHNIWPCTNKTGVKEKVWKTRFSPSCETSLMSRKNPNYGRGFLGLCKGKKIDHLRAWDSKKIENTVFGHILVGVPLA